MHPIFRTHHIDGYAVDIFGYDTEKMCIVYEINGKVRTARQYYVCPFGGNPFPGTLIEYYNIILPNGKKRRLNIYA